MCLESPRTPPLLGGASAADAHAKFITWLPGALCKQHTSEDIQAEREIYPLLRAVFRQEVPELKGYAFQCETKELRSHDNPERCEFKDVANNYHLEVKFFKETNRRAEIRAAEQVARYLLSDKSKAVFLLVYDTREDGGYYFRERQWRAALRECGVDDDTVRKKVVVILVKPPHLKR